MASVFQPCKEDEKDRFYRCTKTRCGHKWTVRYREPGGRAGRQREKSFVKYGPADAFAVRVESEKDAGLYLDPTLGRMLLREWVEVWLSTHQAAESSMRVYRSFTENWLLPALGSKPLSAITLDSVERLRTHMLKEGLKPGTINDRMNCFKAVMRAAVRAKRISENPLDDLKALKVGSVAVDTDEIPTLAEVERLADVIELRYRLAVYLMSGAGLRIGEVLGFTAECQRDGFLRLRRQASNKTMPGSSAIAFGPLKHRVEGEYRDVPTVPLLDDEIGLHVATYGTTEAAGLRVLFPATNGGLLSDSMFRYHWDKGIKAAGLESKGFTPHSLRHFFASTALAEGLPIFEVSRWLGHASIKVTADTYGHLTVDSGDRFRRVMQAALRPVIDPVS